MPKRKDKGGKGSIENISKSTEDVSKVKKKTKFGSIKSFFGRKRKIFKDFSSAQDLRESESIDVDNKSDILSTECWVEDDIGIHNKTTKD